MRQKQQRRPEKRVHEEPEPEARRSDDDDSDERLAAKLDALGARVDAANRFLEQATQRLEPAHQRRRPAIPDPETDALGPLAGRLNVTEQALRQTNDHLTRDQEACAGQLRASLNAAVAW